MNIGRILFLAIFLFCSATLVTVSSFLQSLASQSLTSPSELLAAEQAKQQQTLVAAYQVKLIGILENYSHNQPLLKEKSHQELEQELLALTVPPIFRDLHWQLVQAMESFNQGLTKNARQALEVLVKNYSWLSATLSLFIINNFS